MPDKLIIPALRGLAGSGEAVVLDPQGELFERLAEVARTGSDPFWDARAAEILKSYADFMQSSVTEPPERP